ncbi:HinT-interacting membrane complex protein P80 [Mycoplasma hafezii]|uniref:HinT-interacting membrane complex protein P80 n=1 Tax=Mycoplasma hafezii TaxID=525886 RepID=UPI003CF92008
MAKNKKSFFERLAEVNDQYDNKTNKKTTNKKKRNTVTIAVAAGLTVGVITTIAVPLALNVAKVNYVQPVGDNEPVFSFNDPKSDKPIVENLGSLMEGINSAKNQTSENLQKLYREAVFYWYKEEQTASVAYQFRYNATLNEGDSRVTNIALRSLDEIRTQQKNKIADQKLNLQKTYGYDNWHQKFNELLLSDAYGKSKTEEEAIEFLTFKVVEREATRRFRIKVQLQSENLLKVATKDYKQINEGGTAVTDQNGNVAVSIKKGEAIFPYFKDLATVDNLQNSDFKGVFYYKLPFSNQIVTISTESFIPEQMSFVPLFNQYLANNNLGISTEIELPGTFKNSLNPQFEFSKEDKQKLANWFKYSVIEKDKQYTFDSIFNLAFNKQNGILNQNQADFLAIKNGLTINQARFNLFNEFLGNKETNTAEVNSFGAFFNKNINLGLASLSNNLFNLTQNPNSLPSVDLASVFGMPQGLANTVNTKVSKLASVTDPNELGNEINNLNAFIEEYITNMSDIEFNSYLQSNFYPAFVMNYGQTNQKTSFAYKLSNHDGFLVLKDNKFVWARRNSLDSNTIYANLLAFLQTYTQEQNNAIIDAVNKAQSNNKILEVALDNAKFIESLTNNNDFKDVNINDLKNANISVVAGNKNAETINSLVAIDKWVKQAVQSQNSYNVYIKNGTVYLAEYSSNNQLLESNNQAVEAISNIFKNELTHYSKGAK